MSDNVNQNTTIFIKENDFENVFCKMLAIYFVLDFWQEINLFMIWKLLHLILLQLSDLVNSVGNSCRFIGPRPTTFA